MLLVGVDSRGEENDIMTYLMLRMLNNLSRTSKLGRCWRKFSGEPDISASAGGAVREKMFCDL